MNNDDTDDNDDNPDTNNSTTFSVIPRPTEVLFTFSRHVNFFTFTYEQFEEVHLAMGAILQQYKQIKAQRAEQTNRPKEHLNG